MPNPVYLSAISYHNGFANTYTVGIKNYSFNSELKHPDGMNYRLGAFEVTEAPPEKWKTITVRNANLEFKIPHDMYPTVIKPVFNDVKFADTSSYVYLSVEQLGVDGGKSTLGYTGIFIKNLSALTLELCSRPASLIDRFYDPEIVGFIPHKNHGVITEFIVGEIKDQLIHFNHDLASIPVPPQAKKQEV